MKRVTVTDAGDGSGWVWVRNEDGDSALVESTDTQGVAQAFQELSGGYGER